MPDLRPEFSFVPTEDCFLASWLRWSGGDDPDGATAEIFGSDRFLAIDAAIRTALARLLPICVPGLDLNTTRINCKFVVDFAEDDDDTPIEVAPMIVYYW